MNNEALQHVLDLLDKTETECDGYVRLADYVLSAASVPHKVKVGYIQAWGDYVPLHYWLEIDEYAVDYRLRPITGNKRAPHGVFRYSDYPQVVYFDIEPRSWFAFGAALFWQMLRIWSSAALYEEIAQALKRLGVQQGDL